MIIQQQLTLTLTTDTDGGHKVNIDFYPPLDGKENWEKLGKIEQNLQSRCADICNKLLDILEKENNE